MDAHRSNVDHLDIAVIGLRYRRQYSVENVRFAPPNETVVAGRAGPKLQRYRLPRRTRAQYSEYSVQHAARLVRQQRSDHRPLEIRHHSLPVRNFESNSPSYRNPICGYMT